MLTLYREAHSPEADWVEAELRDMTLAYDRQVLTPLQAAQQFGGMSLPILRDGERMASGREALLGFLRDLAQFAAQWRMFQSDACYVDDDGHTC
ncbi:MAG: hypothetical protein WHV44_09555 [Anaerolineales bacterium]